MHFLSQIATISQFSVYLSVTQAKQMISSSLLNNFYPVISYRRVQKKKKATNYCVHGLSLRSANQLPARGVEAPYNFVSPSLDSLKHLNVVSQFSNTFARGLSSKSRIVRCSLWKDEKERRFTVPSPPPPQRDATAFKILG